ncbi:MAG: thioredoxin domain-containing protein [Chthoniobacterales bacterium]
MKRFLPFILIAVVALLTVGIATAIYRAKMRPTVVATAKRPPAPAPSAAASAAGQATEATPAPVEEKEDPSLHVRGPRNAPVTMEVYGDFQCPSCGHAAGITKELEAEYHGQFRVIFYEFPLAMHEHAVEAAMAAEAAAVQGKFWEMHDKLYEFQTVWSKVRNVGFFFDNYAEAIGLDVARFRADRLSQDLQQGIVAQGEAGTARGVKNTPTIFFNGTEFRGNFTKENLEAALKRALAEKKAP